MEPPFTTPNAVNGSADQSLPLTSTSFSQSAESVECHNSEASNITSSIRHVEVQAAASVTEPLPERPLVPSSQADWEARKQIIRELYMDQNKILNEVIEVMLTKHKFKATARMYKGQFAKWKWTKYNKTNSNALLKSAKSRVAKRRSARTREQPPHARGYLPYFSDDEFQVEITLSAYAALITHWSERETPWKTDDSTLGGRSSTELFGPRDNSILQHVRSAQDHFLAGRPHQGGDMLRRAFLGIEAALDPERSGSLDIEALWDCCLAVPQLVLTMGWTDILSIFCRYLHSYTRIKLPHHPITRVAASLQRLALQTTTATTTTPTSTTVTGGAAANWQHLQAFISRAWHIWIDCVSRVRGDHDDVTIHLKRGYVTLVDPTHAMAGDIIASFRTTVTQSLAHRGAFATTSRILELEDLLVRMYVPLFTPATARRAEEILRGLKERIERKEGNRGRRVDQWDYVDRYLVFSAYYFMASIAEYTGQRDKAAVYRWKSLDSGRDLFWLQTSLLVESRLRTEGLDAEANAILEARVETQESLNVLPGCGNGEGWGITGQIV
ncbi:hypothetical protein N657DRAFT_689193 [Parathielavia appendiculata]|uniref:Clr5 domain-containing protein n=1 Tax=Parathielavia appendiculata TaxID=2587402 RepID=A0AAN6U2V0_9PEZI|nr:hypothetical protein N657DRAFT_689193 [Parathielavia appendiculata]